MPKSRKQETNVPMAMPTTLDAAEVIDLDQTGRRVCLDRSARKPPAFQKVVRAEPKGWHGATMTAAFSPGVKVADHSSIKFGTGVETTFATKGQKTTIDQSSHLPLRCRQNWERLWQKPPFNLANVTVPQPLSVGSVSLGLARTFAPLRRLWLAGHAHAPLGNAGPRHQVWLRKAAR